MVFLNEDALALRLESELSDLRAANVNLLLLRKTEPNRHIKAKKDPQPQGLWVFFWSKCNIA